MYPKEGRNHVFVYHGYALALGGWVRDKNRQFTALPALAPSVLSITGGFCSASEKNVNFYVPTSYVWDDQFIASSFNLFVGHAYTEVRGTVEDSDRPFGAYTTTVRSVLDDVRINDDFYVEHAEAILQSTHDNPGNDTPKTEPEVRVANSNMSGVRVRGQKVTLNPHDDIDRIPKYDDMNGAVQSYMKSLSTVGANAGKGGPGTNPWLADLCNWHDPNSIPPGAPLYVQDMAKINSQSTDRFRYSLFKDAQVPPGNGIKSTFASSVDVENFGRIFFGEVLASKGTKQVTMFRIDLGCDNCGGVGGSDGTTNGGPMP